MPDSIGEALGAIGSGIGDAIGDGLGAVGDAIGDAIGVSETGDTGGDGGE